MSDNEVEEIRIENENDCEIQSSYISVIEVDDSSSSSSEEEQNQVDKEIDLTGSQDCIQVIQSEQSQEENEEEKNEIQNKNQIDVIELDQSQTQNCMPSTQDLTPIDESQDCIRVTPSQNESISITQNQDNTQENLDQESVQNEQIQQKSNQDTSTNKQTTLFRMIFNDAEKFLELKSQITDVIRWCLRENHLEVDFIEDENFLDICAVIKTKSKEQEKNSSNNTEDVDNSNDLIFEIDTKPQNNLDKRAIPSYKRSIKEVLKEDVKRPKLDTDECTRPKSNMCFNCLGNHSIKDCLQPKNLQRIKKNRKAHATRNDRYHKNSSQMYPHLKPGKISEKLRRALGLRSGELPPFVYKMRILGYPPGWLEEAKIPHSGLALFDSEGRKVLESDEEDGEVDVVKYKYDVEKIVSFPGYNVDPGPNYLDDYKHHGVPPMLPKFRKEVFIKSLGDDNILKGYKRKKFKNLSTNMTATENASEDMEIENVEIEIPQIITTIPPPPPLPSDPVPPLPKSPPPPPPPEEPLEPGECEEEDARDSPSLAELEEKQKQLLEALQNSSVLNVSNEENFPSNTDNPIDTNPKETTEEKRNEITQKNVINESHQRHDKSIEVENDASLNSSSCHQSTNNLPTDNTSTPTQSNTKLMLGTPLLKFSPYDKLPSGEKFSVGVSDVINFENLADSTGKYEQMKKVLKKVRNVVTQLNMND